MKNLVATLCLTISVLLGSVGVSSAADYMTGLGAYGRGDYATALREFRPIAEQGGAGAQSLLGTMYRNGRGVLQNYQTAVMWYTRAAEQGDASAQYGLGLMYSDGQGVPQDNVYAHMWFNISNISGQAGRAGVEELMTSAEITTAQNLAEECVQKDYKGCTDDGWGGWKDWILR